jgi:hypothetical protein
VILATDHDAAQRALGSRMPRSGLCRAGELIRQTVTDLGSARLVDAA